MPKSVLFVIFLLLAALGASLTLVTGEASPVRADMGAGEVEELVSEDGEEPEELAEEDALPDETGGAEEPIVEDVEIDPMAAGLEVLANADSPGSDRLAAAKSILAGLEGSESQAALMEQASSLEAAMAADPSAAIPSEFVDAVAALVKGAQGD